MENRIRRLIAVGASVSANCQPCLQYNVGKALEDGVDEKEISEAVEIGRMVRKGAASKMDKFASSLDYSSPSTVRATSSECGCES